MKSKPPYVSAEFNRNSINSNVAKTNKLNIYLLSLTVALSLYMGATMAAEESADCSPATDSTNIHVSWKIDLDKTNNLMLASVRKDQTTLVDNLKPTGIIANSSTNFSHITWIYGSSKTSSKPFFWSLAYESTNSNDGVETWNFYGQDGGQNTYKSVKLHCTKHFPVKWSSITYKKAMDVFHKDGVKVGVRAVRMSYGRCYPARDFSISPENLAFGWDWNNVTSKLKTTLGENGLQSSLDIEPQNPIKSITVHYIPQSVLGTAAKYTAKYKSLVVTSPEWTAWTFSINRDGVLTKPLLLCLVSDTPFSDYIDQGELVSRKPMPLDVDDNGVEIPAEEQPTVTIYAKPGRKQ